MEGRLIQIVIGAAVLTPLVAGRGFSGDQPRPFVTMVLLAVGLAVVAGGAVKRRELQIRRDPLMVALYLLFVTIAVSLTQARIVWHGIHDVLEIGAAIGLYWLMTNASVSQRFFQTWVPGLAVLVGALAAGVSFLQVAGRDPYYGQTTPVSFLGNTNYAGTFCAMLLPVAVGLFFGARMFPLQLGLAAAAALIAGGLWLSRSRAGLLAAWVGVLVAIVGGWKCGRARAAVLALVFAGATVFAAMHVVPRAMEADNPGRVARMEIWGAALRMWTHHPALGVGAGQFEDEFHPYRTTREMNLHNPTLAQFQSVADAHSSYVQALAEYGPAAVLALLLVIYVWTRRAAYFVSAAEEHRGLAAGLTGGIAAFFVGAAFNTLHLWSPHFVTAMAMMGALEAGANLKARFRQKVLSDLDVCVAIGAAFLAAMAAAVLWRPTSADVAYLRAVRTKDVDVRERRLKEARDAYYWSTRTHLALGRTYEAKRQFQDAKGVYEDVTALISPNHPEAWLDLGRTYVQLNELDKAERAARRAVAIAPAYANARYHLGMTLFVRGDISESESEMRTALELRPRFGQAAYMLGLCLWKQDKRSEAVDAFRRAKGLLPDLPERLQKDLREILGTHAWAEIFRD